MVNDHGDRLRPLSRVVGPLPNGLNPLQMGVTNHLLQVGPKYQQKVFECQGLVNGSLGIQSLSANGNGT